MMSNFSKEEFAVYCVFFVFFLLFAFITVIVVVIRQLALEIEDKKVQCKISMNDVRL